MMMCDHLMMMVMALKLLISMTLMILIMILTKNILLEGFFFQILLPYYQVTLNDSCLTLTMFKIENLLFYT